MKTITWTLLGLLALCMLAHGRDSAVIRRELQASASATAIANAVASGNTTAAANAIATVRGLERRSFNNLL